MAAVFGNVGFNGWQLGHLMPSWVADSITCAQTTVTMPTRAGSEIHNGVYAFAGNQRPRVTRMPRLTARFAAALHRATSFTLPSRETVGGRRFRGRGRVLLPQRKLTFQIGDALGLLGNLALAFRELSAQALDLLLQALFRVLALLSLGPRHASHGTPI